MAFRNWAGTAFSVITFACITCGAVAQEGFPLDGTWRGDWQGDDGPTQVVLVMKWDGENVTGRINPGPHAIVFDDAQLHPADWTVTIAATGEDGEPILIEGALADIGSYHRSITGTWTQHGKAYPFRIARE